MNNQNYIGISSDRLNHILGVARKMVKIGKEDYNFDEEKCQELFILGILHDIGYEYSEATFHEKVGSDILKRLGYRDYECIREHGNPNSKYKSDFLEILNKADLSIDNKGNEVSFYKRLEYIKNTYGENSKNYINCLKMIEKLKK